MGVNLLELFAGSREISKSAEEIGFKTFSVDIQPFQGVDMVRDIGELRVSDIPFVPDLIWASFDCTTYSIAGIRKHRHKKETLGPYGRPKSEYAKTCDRVNQHSINLIKTWLSLNPNMVFFIENPRGALRKMPFMQEFDRHTVWNCQYGDERAKPTDIWTNSSNWVPRPPCRNYVLGKPRHCHHHAAPRGSQTGTQGRKGAFERSKVPLELINDVLLSFEGFSHPYIAPPENPIEPKQEALL